VAHRRIKSQCDAHRAPPAVLEQLRTGIR
jgi:hypothetical protein